METILAALRAAAEPTRLRLLSLLAHGDLTVSELTHILGQSQPRVSRHLKLMCESGLLDRFPEGAWVFYRVAAQGAGADLATRLLSMLPADDQTLSRDQSRLEGVRAARASRAQDYFTLNAHQWDQLRSLHVDESEVEQTLIQAIQNRPITDLVDLGTGTGRVLEVLAPYYERGTGIDLSREMLDIARANLERADLRHCMVRQGDITQAPLADNSADLVTVHQVLHYAADPAQVVAEAARILRPGGLLVVVDFAPHDLEILRDQHAHRRLGFADSEVAGWLSAAGLTPLPARHLPGSTLTVVLWSAEKPNQGVRP
ncbi:metalloregulator ArsR/SmtB family transcription factor [Magnetospirillum sp. 64-120]|uniref:ArsR/SmtB family transcription factor n=1 Tax=Magnetospirillum sp. 64-120 TaxID=1895778 RepID=UPI000926B018|nr:metalloregulator ArsR/SmtB family transcription factor [Magnetospirillum sp. 64-120]OJX72690.1 MAG: ArsR family transcriptional regulator [Magnetospirillum sp. 64-120]